MSRTPDLSTLTLTALGPIQPKDVIVIRAPVQFLSQTANKIARIVARFLYERGHRSILVAVIPQDWTVERIPEDVMARYGWVRVKTPPA
jgi:hypothetical protein